MFRTVPVSIIRSFHYTHSNGICHTGQTELRPDPARKLSANLYDICHCCVYSEKLLMMDGGTVRNMYSFIPKNKFGQRNCPKHVEFYSKNKFGQRNCPKHVVLFQK